MNKKENLKAKGSFVRMCSSCNMRFHKQVMFRVVRQQDGTVDIDLSGKKSGRGAYVCKNLKCVGKLQKTKRMSRLLKAEVKDELYDNLLNYINEK